MKKSFTAGIIVASIFGQNLALAFDSTRFSQLSPEGQRLHTMIEDRLNNMSESAKLKLSYRLYKITFNALPRFEKMSDTDFSNKLNENAQKNNANPVTVISDEEVLIQKDFQDALPTAQELQGISSTAPSAVDASSVSHSQVTESIRTVMEKIGYHEDENGNRKPLTRAQFNEKALQFSSISKSGRSVASSSINSILTALMWIAIVCAAVGVIVIFGWIAVAIILGGLLIGVCVYLMKILGAAFTPY